MMNIDRCLRKVLLFPLAKSHNRAKVKNSRFIWGDRGNETFVLTPLGVINSARRSVGLDPWAI